MTVIVPLTKGKVTLVDDDDAPSVLSHVWLAHRTSTKRENWYAYTSIDSRKVYLHRFLVRVALVDHRDGDGLNNRRANLRPCTGSQNAANAIRPTNSCGFIGVDFNSLRGGRYGAWVSVKHKRVRKGWFKTPEEAARVRDLAAIETYGGFAKLNFPQGAQS
jgi:hypothetical protein